MGSWEWVPERGELTWSDNHFRLFGLKPHAIVPSTDFVLERTHLDDRGFVTDAISELIAGGSPDRDLEYRILAVDGTARTLRMTVAALAPGEGLPHRIVGSVQDVSSLRRLDRQLAAHVAVTRGLDRWNSLEQGAGQLLEYLAEALEVPFGAFWVPDGTALAAWAIWHVPSPELDAVAASTADWHRAPATRRSVGQARAAKP